MNEQSNKADKINVWQSFKKSTTAHGIPHVSNAKGTAKKIFWAMICLIMISTMVFHLYNLFTNYLSFGVTVHTRIQRKYQMEFPAVTVCNINAVRSSQLYRSEALSSLYGSSSKKRRKRDTGGIVTKDMKIKTQDQLSDRSDFLKSMKHEGEVAAKNGTIRKQNMRSKRSSAYDVIIYYDDIDKSGPNLTVYPTDPVNLPPEWQDRASAMVITGPSYWKVGLTPNLVLYWGFKCPGDYKYGDNELPFNNAIESQQIMSGPLCVSIPTYFATNHTIDKSTSCWKVNYTCLDGYHFSDGSAFNLLNCSGRGSGNGYQWKGNVPSCKGETTTYSDVSTNESPTETSSLSSTNNPVNENHTQISEQADTATTTEQEWNSRTGGAFNSGETITYSDVSTNESPTETSGLSSTNNPVNENHTQISKQADTATTTEQESNSRTGGAINSGETTTDSEVSTNGSPTEISDFLNAIPDSNFTKNKREDFLKQEFAMEALSNIPEETKKEMGFQRSDLVLDCSYEGEDCSGENFFEPFYHPELGNCYIFNSGWNSSKTLKHAYRVGQRHGLQLMINVNQSEYIEGTLGPAGARVVLHPQRSMSYPSDEGILARPGEVISLGIKRVDYTRKPYPYGNCTEDYNDKTADVYTETYPVEYSSLGCIQTCYQKAVIKRCGCGNSQYPLTADSLGGSFKVCSMYDPTQIECRETFDAEFTKGNVKCHCPQRCSETAFIAEVSTAQWPAKPHLNLLMENMQKRNIVFNDTSEVESHLLKVNIYFRSLEADENIELPAYSESQLVSDLGGAFGLWFGLSVITMIEFMEFFIDVFTVGCMHCCSCLRRQNRVSKPAKDHSDMKGTMKGPLPQPEVHPGRVFMPSRKAMILNAMSKSNPHPSPMPRSFVKRVQTIHT